LIRVVAWVLERAGRPGRVPRIAGQRRCPGFEGVRVHDGGGAGGAVRGLRSASGCSSGPTARWSPSAAESSLDASAPAWSHAAELSRRLAPPDPAYVLDVCETDRGLRLLELNPFSGARARSPL